MNQGPEAVPGGSSGPLVAGESPIDDAQVGRIFREESGRSVATLVRVLGDIDLAEEAVQEAFVAQPARWPERGLPPNPGAWITTTARNRAIDACAASPARRPRDQAAATAPPRRPPQRRWAPCTTTNSG